MVTDSGSSSAHVFDFVIPRGADGKDGPMGPTGPTGPTGPSSRSRYVADLEGCVNETTIINKINELLAALRDSGLMDR